VWAYPIESGVQLDPGITKPSTKKLDSAPVTPTYGMAMPQRPSDDPDGGARHQPGAEPAAAEWLLPPPALSAIVLQSSSGGGEEEAAGPLPPPSPTAVLRSPSGGDPGRRRPSFELRCLVSLAKTYLHNAPPSAPQR